MNEELAKLLKEWEKNCGYQVMEPAEDTEYGDKTAEGWEDDLILALQPYLDQQVKEGFREVGVWLDGDCPHVHHSKVIRPRLECPVCVREMYERLIKNLPPDDKGN